MRAYERISGNKSHKEVINDYYINISFDYGEEIWKPLKGYETKYEVSNYSRIRYKKDKKLKLPNIGSSHYMECSIKHNFFREYHSLPYWSLITFKCDRPNDNSQIHHIDKNPYNNHISNIMFVSSKEHFDKHKKEHEKFFNTRRKLKIYQYNKNGELIEVYDSAHQCAIALGISRSCVDRYINDGMKNKYWDLVIK